ncbi:MAG: DUF4870 domain-containing protein [Pyrinomonadaceae bacterium]
MSEHGKSIFDLDANIVSLLCYLGNVVCGIGGLVLSIIVVVQDKNNRLARFHAWQSIFTSVLGLCLTVIYMIVGFVAGIIDAAIGFPIFSLGMVLITGLISLALFVFVVIAAIKGLGGQEYKIPIVGNIAEKYV